MRMVLNPDVTVQKPRRYGEVQHVRSATPGGETRGEERLERLLADGSVVTACAEACPTHAITFGDLNDTKSSARLTSENNRAYHALEEVGVKPNIFYMTKVRNVEPTQA